MSTLGVFDTERLLDARYEASREDYEPDTICECCGCEFYAGVIPAGYHGPAEARWPECPRCGS